MWYSMFYQLLNHIFESRGIVESDFYKLLSSHTITDEEIFVISRFIVDNQNLNIFFSKSIGDMEIRLRFFDIELDYDILNKNKSTLATIMVNFHDESLYVVYKDVKVEIRLDLVDYKGSDKKNTVLYMRMQVLNEILTRYYSKLLYAIYLERRRLYGR